MADEIIAQSEEEKPPRTWDFFLTVFLLLMLVVLTAILFLGFGLSVATLGCADSSAACNGLAISIGTLTATIGTAAVALAGIITSVVFIARRKVSFVVPLVSCLAVVGLFLLGSWLVRLAVP